MASHHSITEQKHQVTSSNFLQLITHILVLMTQPAAKLCLKTKGGNSISNHPIFLDVDTLTCHILFIFSLFVDNFEMISPSKFQPSTPLRFENLTEMGVLGKNPPFWICVFCNNYCPSHPFILKFGMVSFLGWLKKGGAEKICYLRGDPKCKGGAVTLKDTMHLENISFSLWQSIWWLN